jgi:hypothetical protein
VIFVAENGKGPDVRLPSDIRSALLLIAETQNILSGTRCRQVNADHRLYLDDARGNCNEAQAQRVEL